MRIVVLYNPVAGKGRAAAAARDLSDRLGAAGYDVATVATRLEPAERWLDPVLAGADALVVAGGDGAVRIAGEPAVRASVPLYHFPLGTENLFAREFRMDRSVPRLLGALARGAVIDADVGMVAGRPFFLMGSIGFDAEVVRDLAEHRNGGISHLSYVGPLMRQLLRWKPSRLTIRTDGETLVENQLGMIVVANCRQYARRLDPARRASVTSGRLDAVFLPTRSRAELLRWMVDCFRGRHLDDPRVRYGRARVVDVRCEPACAYQLDGDAPETDEVKVSRLRFEVRKGVLPVLLPPHNHCPSLQPASALSPAPPPHPPPQVLAHLLR